MPPIWFDPTPWLTQLWTVLFWGAVGLIGLIAVVAIGRAIWAKLFWWNR